jgi:hypothetical protein
MSCHRIHNGIICVSDELTEVGARPPSGYIAWQEWAEAQYKAGLRQETCCRCGKWKFPQELSETVIETTAHTRSGDKVKLRSKVCLKCADSHEDPTEHTERNTT